MKQDVVLLVLSCLGIAQAIFLIVYLLTLKKANDHSHFYLAFIILGLTIRIGKSILNVYFDLEPWQRNLGIAGILMVGPFLWFYGQALFIQKKRLYFKDYLQLVPFFLFATFSTLIPNDGRPISYIIYILVFAHLALYLGLATSLFFGQRMKVHPQRASWFRNLLIGISLIWVFYMGNLAGVFSFYIGGAVFFSFLIYIFSFLFLQKHAFRLGKYNASTLDKSHSSDLMDGIKTLFSEEEIYLDPQLSLESMSKRLGVSPRKLSQSINENEEKNFSDFVNEYRIEKARRLLSDPRYAKEKIASVAYDCGFGNVTSFNLAFKSKTRMTPSAYRKERLAESSESF